MKSRILKVAVMSAGTLNEKILSLQKTNNENLDDNGVLICVFKASSSLLVVSSFLNFQLKPSKLKSYHRVDSQLNVITIPL